MHTLSKSKLIAYRQCHKRLWLEVHRPELRDDSADTKASYSVGHEVGAVARSIYDPTGNGSLIHVTPEGFEEALSRSAKLLRESVYPIFEAGFRAKGGLAFSDVMLPAVHGEHHSWKMVEVKSSTVVKNYHREDAAIQTFIARAAGVDLRSIAIACIDSSWTYAGDGNYQGLIKETDITEEVGALQEQVERWVTEAHTVAACASEPTVSPGAHCHTPFACGFYKYCSRFQPDTPFPVTWLPGLTPTQRTHFAQNRLIDLGAVSDEILSPRQRLVKQHTLAGTVFFDAAGAAADLAPHGFPARFLDFETINFAVPRWTGTRPYQQIPFQFNLHTTHESGAVEQTGFLDLSGQDPSEKLAESLLAACGDRGPIFAYNAAFESGCIRGLAHRRPSYAAALRALDKRIVDLLPIARTRYYHPQQQGSWSIKALLPALVPELRYDDLSGTKNGDMAMAAYVEALRPDTSPERREAIRDELIAYCRLDTWAMVRIWQRFSGRAE